MLLASSGSRAADPAPAPTPTASKLDLTPDTVRKIHDLVRPHDNEWRHLRVNWLTDVTAARKKAAAEDKPIVILYTGGAGYNEPLGVC
jgi:hypothetical protein